MPFSPMQSSSCSIFIQRSWTQFEMWWPEYLMCSGPLHQMTFLWMGIDVLFYGRNLPVASADYVIMYNINLVSSSVCRIREHLYYDYSILSLYHDALSIVIVFIIGLEYIHLLVYITVNLIIIDDLESASAKFSRFSENQNLYISWSRKLSLKPFCVGWNNTAGNFQAWSK